MLAGQHVRRADGTVWQVTEIRTTIRARHPGMTGEHVGEVSLAREHNGQVETARLLTYGNEQGHRLRLPPAEHLTIVRDQP